MASQDLKFRLLGEDAGASRALSKVQQEASGAHDAFGKLGDELSNMGGPFSVVQEGIQALSGGFEHIKEHGKSVGSVLTGVGVAATGAGVLLAQLGAKDQQAQAQLRASVESTGHSWSDFKDQIEEAIKSQERFGHGASDTQDALNALTIALQDPNKALQEMGLVADIAAKKHISLAEAAQFLIRIQEGGVKGLKEFGIVLDGNGSKADQLNRALDEMAQRLAGQADAAADTFSGRLSALKAHADDVLSSLSNVATVLTSIGPVVTGAGAAISWLTSKKQESAAASVELAASEDAVAAAETRVAVAARTEGGSLVVGGLGKGALLRAGTVALGGYAIGQAGSYLAGGGRTGSIISGTATGAGLGAAVGSVVPVVGTAIGAGVGAVAGGLIGAFTGGGDDNLKKLAASGPVGLQVVKDRQAAAQQELMQREASLRLLMSQQQAARGPGGMNAPPSHDLVEQMHQVSDLKDKVANYNKVLKDQAAADKEAAHATALLNQQQAKLVPVIDKDVEAMHHFTDVVLASGAAADAFQKGLNDLTAATVKNAKGNDVVIRTLTGTSDAAIQNRDSLRQLASAELTRIDTLRKTTSDTRVVRAEAIKMSTELEKQALKVYGNKKAVDAFLGSLHLLPKQVATEVKLSGKDKLAADVARIRALIGSIPTDRVINMELVATGHGGRNTVSLGDGQTYAHHAMGGLITGGVQGKDSVRSLLMPGEFVVRADRSNLYVGTGGGTTINVTVNAGIGTNGAEVGRQVVAAIREHKRTTGQASLGL
jgi:hypothetical protein